MARIEDSKKAQEVLLFVENARINVKKITEEALVKPTSKENIKSKIEAQIKACSEFLKAQGPIYQELAKSAFNGLKKLSNECLKQIDAFFAANQSNDLVKALALAYKQETDTTKKTSKTFVIGDGDLDLEEDMSVKFKETSGEYGYDQMIIDDYQERVKEAIKNISKLTLTEKTFKEVNGRKVGAPVFLSIRNKAEMTVRYEAMKEELKELCDSGEQYVIVSQHKDASKRCAPLQGLLYKLDVDPSQDVKCVLSSKELGTRSPKQLGTVDGNPYYSLKEAMSYGLFSYNCRHRFIKYIPGSKVTPQYKYDEKAAEQKREIDENMREMERQIRMFKERQVLALDSKERKFYQNASKQAQAKYKAYATKHGRDINLWRCSITKAERSAKGLTKTVEKENSARNVVPEYVEINDAYRTDEYKNCLKNIGFNKQKTNAIYKGIKKIFSEKSKTTNERVACRVEGIYLVDLKNISKTFYNGEGNPSGVLRPKEAIRYLFENKNSDLLVIHNHRGDSIPSSADIEQLCRMPNNNKGIVVGNKGNIYYYEVTKQIDKSIIKEYSIYEEQDDYNLRYYKFVEFCEQNGIIFKHLRKGGENV